MQYGYFDDKAYEYVITRLDTHQSWSNYLDPTEYGAITTNNAGGYGFYQSGARGRFLRLRKFRSHTYRIVVHNPDHVCRGVVRMTVNGHEVSYNLILPSVDGAEQFVEVWLGGK